MRTAIELIQLSLELENNLTAAGDLRARPGQAATLLWTSQHRDGYVTYFSEELPAALRQQIIALGPGAPLSAQAHVCQILAQYNACQEIWAGEGYHFATAPPPAQYAAAVRQAEAFVVLVNGEAASWAWTQDESANAAELAVETRTEFRRRGYARQVASAWAAHVIGQGKVAFYSHRSDNEASRRLAQNLGVTWYARSVTYS